MNINDEIRTRDRLIINILISCQNINLTKKLKLLNKILKYNLYYFLIIFTAHYLNSKPHNKYSYTYDSK
jgi:hypothetical protein